MKMGMDICGMDIAFQNDDMNSELLVLEVSPRFSQIQIMVTYPKG